MSDKKKDKNVYKLWHERMDESKIMQAANDLVRKYMKMGVKIHTINVFWDDNGKFITQTRGAHIKRRVEDKKTPENH